MSTVYCTPTPCRIVVRDGAIIRAQLEGWRDFRDAKTKRPPSARASLVSGEDCVAHVRRAIMDGTAGVVMLQRDTLMGAGDGREYVRIEDVRALAVTEPTPPAPVGMFSLVTVSRTAGDVAPFTFNAQYPCAVLGFTVFSRQLEAVPVLHITGAGVVEVEPIAGALPGGVSRSYRVPSRPSVAVGREVQIVWPQDGRTLTAVVYVELAPQAPEV